MTRYRLPMLVGCLLFSALLYPLSQRIKYDQSVRSLFPEDHPQLLTYYQVNEEFGLEATCLVAYTDPDLLCAEGLRRLDQFARTLSAVDGILEATSLAELPRPSAAYRPRPLVDWMADPAVDPVKLRQEIVDCDLYRDYFIGPDGQTAAVVLRVDREAMASGRFEQTLVELRSLADAHRFPAQVVGAPVMISDVYAYLAEDAWVLTYVSSIAMMAVILILFRNLRWMILPIVVVQIALIWTRALMVLLDIRLSIISSMMTALVTVIGIATAIHVAVRYREEMSKDADPTGALQRTLWRVVPAVFWTCMTTAAGFGALAVSRLKPVQDYALIMAAASLFVGIASFLVVPGGVLLGHWRSVPRPAPGEATLATGLGRIVDFVGKHSPTTILVVVLVLALAAAGFQWLEVETDFTQNFRADSSVMRGYRFVEERLGGAGMIDLVFVAPKRPTTDFLARVRQCEQRLRAIPGVTKVTGLPDLLDYLALSNPLRSTALGAFLPRASIPDAQLMTLLRLLKPSILKEFWNTNSNRMRIVLRVREQQAVQGKAMLLSSIERTACDTLGLPARASGLYALLVYLIENLLADQWLTFAVSASGILLMTSIAFRSARLGFVALVPNLVPIVAVIGTMGWLGLKLNVATAMIGSISMGLVVDFSIHYLSRFCQERRQGADFYTALSHTHRSTGKAMVFANLALMLGFCVLVLSNFVPTIHFGLLVSVAILGGLLGNLLMLPVLLRLVYWVKRPAIEDQSA